MLPRRERPSAAATEPSRSTAIRARAGVRRKRSPTARTRTGRLSGSSTARRSLRRAWAGGARRGRRPPQLDARLGGREAAHVDAADPHAVGDEIGARAVVAVDRARPGKQEPHEEGRDERKPGAHGRSDDGTRLCKGTEVLQAEWRLRGPDDRRAPASTAALGAPVSARGARPGPALGAPVSARGARP